MQTSIQLILFQVKLKTLFLMEFTQGLEGA
jgi:hypothetical protein